MTNHFDQAAQHWDSNPMHWERTRAIKAELLKMVPVRNHMKALEFGSGTGLLSFALKDYVAHITLMDNSSEMNKQAAAKIKATGAAHLVPLHFDLEKNDFTNGTFDLIFTQMAMHHVKDVPALIGKFSRLLNTGGFIAIADLYTEDGTFHDRHFDGHFGFDPDFMKETIANAGFSEIVLKACFEIIPTQNEFAKNESTKGVGITPSKQFCFRKPVKNEYKRQENNQLVKVFPVFLVVGKKL